MSYKNVIVKDSPIGYWPLSENTGTTIIDESGCNNNGTASSLSVVKIPLVSDGSSVARLMSDSVYLIFNTLNSYSQESLTVPGFANKYSSDNDFSLECWIYPQISDLSEIAILADIDNEIGIFWDQGNIVFKLNSETLSYTISDFNQALHIVATYSVDRMSIYLNGNLAVFKTLESFSFSNTSLEIQSGPIDGDNNYFILDNVAIYRYALNENQTLNHYSYIGYTIPYQVVIPDDGELFEFVDSQMNKTFTYSYPYNKSWEGFLNEDVVLNRSENYIEMLKTNTVENKEFIIEDIISIPSAIPMDSSKIEWAGHNGISVETSIDGITYEQCVNGQSIPQFLTSSFSDSKVIYLKITMSSTDTSKYCPKLYSLTISFYNQQIMYSRNGNSYLSKVEDCDAYLGTEKHPISFRNNKNGILVPLDSGFKINTDKLVKSIEFFYTPYDNLLSGPSTIPGSIINVASFGDGEAASYSWDNGFTISKTNIESLYVNTVDYTSETNMSYIFAPGNLHHVVISFSDPVTGELIFNINQGDGPKALYQNLSLYTETLDYNKIKNHYSLYLGKSTYTAETSATNLSENSVNLYNNDWLVIQNS